MNKTKCIVLPLTDKKQYSFIWIETLPTKIKTALYQIPFKNSYIPLSSPYKNHTPEWIVKFNLPLKLCPNAVSEIVRGCASSTINLCQLLWARISLLYDGLLSVVSVKTNFDRRLERNVSTIYTTETGFIGFLLGFVLHCTNRNVSRNVALAGNNHR